MERDLKKKRRTGSGEKAGTETAERRLYQMEYSSPIGALTLISDSKALLSLEFEQKRYPFSLPERCQLTVLPDYSGNRGGRRRPGELPGRSWFGEKPGVSCPAASGRALAGLLFFRQKS